MKIKRGSTSVRRLVFIADSSSTTGAGLANLAHDSAGLVAYYFAGDLSNEVQITLATATLGSYTSGGFVAVDNTNMPGWYEIGIPDAALDGGNECAIQFRGATNMVPVNVYIELDAFDYQTATQPVNVTQFGGTNGTFSSGRPEVNTTHWEGTAVGSANVLIDGAITAAKIASDAITAAKVASDAVTEIQSGLSTLDAAAVRSAIGLALANLDTQLAAIADYIDTEVAAIKSKTDNLPVDPADQSAVEAAITAATSGLASQASVDTLASYVDTEVAAIKAKTDNLPADPADASDIAASFSTVNSTLATIAAYIDTEIAAIKAKTDNLPADPADASDIAASFSSIASSIATLTAYVDTEVAAIKAKTDNLPTDPADQSAVEAAITAAASLLATAAELAKVPKQGETRRYTQIAANAGSKTADVSIGAPL